MARRVCLLGAYVLLLSYFALNVKGEITHPREVSALKDVHDELEDPDKNLNNWKKKDPCTSNWTGVICNLNYSSDGYLHIIELRLPNMNLTGKLSPKLGQLSYLDILNFMWNNISGSIPKDIGNLKKLKLLLLTGNQISGPFPDELGFLPNLTRLQVDSNFISGPLPKSFANLVSVKHFHMNNNSISGQIPEELSVLPELLHCLLDNNKLTGYIPSKLSEMPKLRILQLDNNNFDGTEIPESYGKWPSLLKLSLRNCSLKGSIPDFSGVPKLLFLDLSLNQLTGSIPTNKLSDYVITIDLSKNNLGGPVPLNFSGLPHLQKLSLENNALSGNVSTTIWENIKFDEDDRLTLNFQNNSLSNLAGSLDPPPNISIMLQGNPVCQKANELKIVKFCQLGDGGFVDVPRNSSNSSTECPPHACPTHNFYEYVPDSPQPCFCAAPLRIWLMLRSPSISEFQAYIGDFKEYITSNFQLEPYQLVVDTYMWEEGPRLNVFLKFFPQFANNTDQFNTSALQNLTERIASFTLPLNDTFGPSDFHEFILLGPYANVVLKPLGSSGMSKGLLAGIVLGSIACGAIILLVVASIFFKSYPQSRHKVFKKQATPKATFKKEGVKGFSFAELEAVTDSFSVTSQIGQGGYGKVYKGILADGTVVAVKRAHQISLQGEQEFFTEIELLSRLHHRNLVPLVGYCDEGDEQMLVYEFMPNGSLHNLLSGKDKSSLSLAMRLQIALDSAKGILYLHTEADPPIIHRDIKANNILLDSKLTAKVSDFGISRLAPVSDGKGADTAHVYTVVKGTPGYLDPEYFLTHKLTEKSDVYSLGIVFLELLTGLPPIFHGRNMFREVHIAYQAGRMLSIVDRSMGSYTSESVKKFMDLAFKCCEDEPRARPSMLEIVRELENLCSMLPQSETSTSDGNASSSTGISRFTPTSLDYGNSAYVSTDYPGSDLVSGVIPTISPR
ncbi:hypothetical protein UlMin_000584 [Ulmus minor]